MRKYTPNCHAKKCKYFYFYFLLKEIWLLSEIFVILQRIWQNAQMILNVFMRRINKEVDPQYLNCPIRNVIDKFGDKWSLLVLYQLHDKGTLRFNELHREMADCSQKMLSQTLKRLEQIGLISRQVYPEVPPRVEYSLTARGQSLMPHVSALIGWALEHFGEIAK